MADNNFQQPQNQIQQSQQSGLSQGYPAPQYQQSQINPGNPYFNNSMPPQYQQPVYLTDEERLKLYMSKPKFVAIRDLLCSPLVLIYAVLVSLIFVVDLSLGLSLWLGSHYEITDLTGYFHPFYFLLGIGAFTTYFSANNAKTSGKLPKTSGLSICRAIAIIMLVISAIGIGLVTIIYAISIFKFARYYGFGNSYTIIYIIVLVIFITLLLLTIKFYATTANNIKFMRSCLTEEDCHSKISIFPSIFLIITSALSAAVIIISTFNLFGYEGMLRDFRSRISSTTNSDVADIVYNAFLNQGSSIPGWITIAVTVIGILVGIVTAIIYIKAAPMLNPFADTYE